MPDYQWAVGKGRIVTADYDRSMALNAEQVENELRTAINNLFDGADVSPVSDEYKEVYKITIPKASLSLSVSKEPLRAEEAICRMNKEFSRKPNT